MRALRRSVKRARRDWRRRAKKLADCPWDFSQEAEPGERGIPPSERVSEQAAELGRRLERMAKLGDGLLIEQGIEVPEPCTTCAFRAGSVPSQCDDTVMDALKCVLEGVPFLCHEPRKGSRTIDRACFGWMRARAFAVAAPDEIDRCPR